MPTVISKQKKIRTRKIRIDSNIILSEPSPFVTRSVLTNSLSQVFDEARQEWSLSDVIDSTSEGFSDNCELCNTPHLSANFVIHNPLTERSLRVGSRCIIRFGVVKGSVDAASGSLILNNFISERNNLIELRTLLSSVMIFRPHAQDLHDFHNALKKVLDIKGIKEPALEQLGEICYEDRWSEVKNDRLIPHRLMPLWKNPGSIDAIRSKRIPKDEVFVEGKTLGYKKRKSSAYGVGAGRSNIYKVERHVERKDSGIKD
ncbi:hypothetical protein [Cohnella sp. WQ 127256]|uniref:hypothetical protein n=1 Tax=Cohnella sp. WQ 127256 TaxID=2938790 RepID=UPI00211814EA|nr:hypothetical protein [Cohnella sp. WQ 127256]